MKNEHESWWLLEEKVELYIADDAKYQEVALIVDRPDFLRDVAIRRKDLRIEAPVVDVYDKFSDIFGRWDRFYEEWTRDNPSEAKYLPSRVNRVLKKFNCPDYLTEAITQAVLLKAVVDYSSIVKTIRKGTSFDRTTIGIFPTKSTTYDELIFHTH